MPGRGTGRKSAGGRPKSNPAWGFFVYKYTSESARPDEDFAAVDGEDGAFDLEATGYSHLKPGEALGYCKVPGCKDTVDVSTPKWTVFYGEFLVNKRSNSLLKNCELFGLGT